MRNLKKAKKKSKATNKDWKLIFYAHYEINIFGTIRRRTPAAGTSKGRVLKPYLQFKAHPEGDLRVSLQRGKGIRKQTTVKKLLRKAWGITCHYQTH